MAALRRGASPRTRRQLRGRGVRVPALGVPAPVLQALAEEHAPDTALARRLWASGRYDARRLALRVVDPGQLTPADLDRWARDVADELLLGELVETAARSPSARTAALRFIRARRPWVAAAGWRLVALLADRPALAGDRASLLAILEASPSIGPAPTLDAQGAALEALACVPDGEVTVPASTGTDAADDAGRPPSTE
ncbi:MAG: DNA alkylation repair protein [Sandaracinaceae bacterium]